MHSHRLKRAIVSASLAGTLLIGAASCGDSTAVTPPPAVPATTAGTSPTATTPAGTQALDPKPRYAAVFYLIGLDDKTNELLVSAAPAPKDGPDAAAYERATRLIEREPGLDLRLRVSDDTRVLLPGGAQGTNADLVALLKRGAAGTVIVGWGRIPGKKSATKLFKRAPTSVVVPG